VLTESLTTEAGAKLAGCKAISGTNINIAYDSFDDGLDKLSQTNVFF